MEGDTFLWCGSFGVCLLSGVERVDIGLVVLLVVKLHNLAGNVGLEGLIRVREIWKSVLTGHF